MNKYWINQGAPNTDFWAHEFSKHATCYSTFDVPCYGPEYVEHQEVPEFFETAIKYYQRLPTYEWLSAQGIKPSNRTTVALTDLQSALVKGYGALPYIGCSGPRWNETSAGKGSKDNGRTQISEVWYYFHVSSQTIRMIYCTQTLMTGAKPMLKSPDTHYLQIPMSARVLVRG
jgi:ribonuclease T2